MAQTTPDPPTNQCTQFSYLGVPAPAGMSDCNENMSRTAIGMDAPIYFDDVSTHFSCAEP